MYFYSLILTSNLKISRYILTPDNFPIRYSSYGRHLEHCSWELGLWSKSRVRSKTRRTNERILQIYIKKDQPFIMMVSSKKCAPDNQTMMIKVKCFWSILQSWTTHEIKENFCKHYKTYNALWVKNQKLQCNNQSLRTQFRF